MAAGTITVVTTVAGTTVAGGLILAMEQADIRAVVFTPAAAFITDFFHV